MSKLITEQQQFQSSLLHRVSKVIVKGDEKIKNEIAPLISKKKYKKIYKTFLKSKVTKEFLATEGWELEKSNEKNKIKASIPKKENVYFEDRIWALFAEMGADQINGDSENTKLKFGKTKTKKVDVFVVIEKVIIIIECKCANKENTSFSGNQIIEEIISIKTGAKEFLESMFPDFTVIYALALQNYTVGDAIKLRMKEGGIFLFDENKIEYYEYLNNSLGYASRYQFFAEIFNKLDITNFDPVKVNAIKKMNIDESITYSFFIKAKDLLRIAYIFHSDTSVEGKKGYQRLVKPARRKQVETYIVNGGSFPNSLIVSLNEEVEFESLNDVDPNTELGTLTLPNKYGSVFIIDGQHRLYGYANIEEKYDEVLSVTAFKNLEIENQIQLFIDINSKQKPVSPSLLIDLNADLLWASNNVNEAIVALRTRLITNLGSSNSSPLAGRIKIGEKKNTRLRCITVDYILKYALTKTNFFGKYKGRTFLEEGWFLSKTDVTNKEYDKSLKKSQVFLELIFSKIQTEVPDMWNMGNFGTRAFIAMNIGVFSIIRLCDHILKYRKEEGDDFNTLDANQISEHVWSHLKCVIEHINNLNDNDLYTYRGYSTGGINETAVKELLVVLNTNFPKINPEALKKYLKESQTQYNLKASPILHEIEINLKSIIVWELQKKFTSVGVEWYLSGVPQNIKDECLLAWGKDGRTEDEHNYLYLTNYKEIIEFNKKELLPIFTIRGEEQKSDKDKISWFNKLIKIRNKAGHPSRNPISKDEYEFIEYIGTWLSKILIDVEKKEDKSSLLV
jgi:DNA sulfur modification protein DndB